MGVNIRAKGQTGERDVQKILNDVVEEVYRENQWGVLNPKDLPFQRNQNQSAVGGADLSNPFKLEIEVKRQEALSINTWWNQCVASGSRVQGSTPILIFKQNHKKWRIMMFADLPIKPPGRTTPNGLSGIRVEITLEDFKVWWKAYFLDWLLHNNDR